ncbi:MotA/TolQ/ExbB proton channel family protein [Wolinella succinogenes]|uniref:MotA/TolQ/ExbB proton channel family protein n=1 Tax=Wolinella succinogenes TaxID=844 RepID=UPI0016BA2F34|nr:MotA/TolQ/ExbB proton channel family protein [Wolinella succinogenes]
MKSLDSLFNYLADSGVVTHLVLGWLSIYFITTVWVFIYRYLTLSNYITREKNSLEILFMGQSNLPRISMLNSCIKKKGKVSREILEVCKHKALREATIGLTILSIIASTAPFIGLFGTVVEILEAFSKLGGGARASLDVIAPVISKALVATAAGILTAIPAYSFHLFLKRKAFELSSYLQMQMELLLSDSSLEE